MKTSYRHFAPLCVLCSVAACDPTSSGDEDAASDDESSDSDTMADTDDPSGPGTTVGTTDSDSDPTGADPTGDPTGSDPTGDPGEALADSVFLYIHHDSDSTDSVRAYDIATDQSWAVTDFGGEVEIRSVAIHPNRASLAISSFYQLTTAWESEGIWRVPAAGGEPELIMDAWPGETNEGQNVYDLAYSYDGAHIYFAHSTSTTGGETIARVADGGGVPELFLDSNGNCVGQAGPSPGPNGSQLLSVRTDCVDLALRGLVVHDLPPTNVGVVAIPEGDLYDFSSVAPQWSADGTVVLFQIDIQFDPDGDGIPDANGDSIMIWDTASGELFELVPPADHQVIRSFALSPTETHIVMSMAGAVGEDLVLVDLTGEALSYRTLTNDGQNYAVAW